MSNSKFDLNHARYENQISQIIEVSLIEQYGTNGYKSIIKTMMKECGRSEKEITGNYGLFANMVQTVFGRIGDTKILDPIKMEINRLETNQANMTKQVPNTQTKQIRLLIADDNPHVLSLYEDWLKLDNRHVITAENGQKCLEIYCAHSKLNQIENYFDVVILDHNMPVLNGVQTASAILKINPNQRIIFASGYIENIILDSLTEINKVIEVIKKPFSIEALDDMINNKTLLNKFEEINLNQKRESISTRHSNAMTILNEYSHK